MNELPETMTQKDRKARKEHRCCECGRCIQRGERYRFTSGIWDHSPESFKQCMTCARFMDAAASLNDYPDEGPCFTGLYEWLDETGLRQEVMETVSPVLERQA